MNVYRFRSITTRTAIYSALIIGAAAALFPFVWMVLTSLKSYSEATIGTFLPKEWLWSNYPQAWEAMKFFPRYLENSVFIALATVLGVLATSSLAGYAFARMRFPGRDALFVLVLFTMMIPGEVELVPNYILINRLGWNNTYFALIVPWIAGAFSIFLMRQFFIAIPDELYDAAVLDGCGHFRFLVEVVLPLSAPALITSALFTFLSSWNSLEWPLLVTTSQAMRPIQVGLASFVSEAGTQVQWLMAAATMTIVPVVLIYFVAQRWFMEGISTTGLKG
jgi:ABC-type glycerol-3-phosphate transport system permease component